MKKDVVCHFAWEILVDQKAGSCSFRKGKKSCIKSYVKYKDDAKSIC